MERAREIVECSEGHTAVLFWWDDGGRLECPMRTVGRGHFLDKKTKAERNCRMNGAKPLKSKSKSQTLFSLQHLTVFSV